LDITTTTMTNLLLIKIRKFFFLVLLLYPFISAIEVLAQEQEQEQEETWTVNFRNADIEELIRFVAEATGKTIIVDPVVQGTVQVISTTPVNSDALYQLFLSILEVQGYAAVESSNVVRIIPAQNARTTPLPLNLDQPAGDSSEIITQVIQVDNVSAVQLVPILRPLAAQQAQMTAYDASNSIIVTDTAANIERIRMLAEFIDTSAVPQTEIITLENASADAVVEMLNQLGSEEGAEPDGFRLVADERTNSILVSGDELQVSRLQALINRLDTPLAQVGNVSVIYLQYARAEELAPLLNSIIRNNSSSEEGESVGDSANVEADSATNSLIVMADPEILQSLKAVIARLDIRRAQVLVEAIIVEMLGENGQDLGVQWLFLNDNGAYGSTSTGSGLLTAITGAAISSGATDQNGNPLDVRAPLGTALASTPGGALGVGRLDDELSFNFLINALQTDEDANILSTPSLLTLDNEEAIITVGRNVPFVTGSFTSTGNNSNPDSPFQTVERQNVGVTLRVTPHINEGDSLVLELSQEVSSLLGSGSVLLNGNPITNERIIETTVLADNGQTVILGGLIEDSVTQTNQRISKNSLLLVLVAGSLA
jgi:general secretion pathway protein D